MKTGRETRKRAIANCQRCGDGMPSLNKTGLCFRCRTVKCAHEGCEERLVIRGMAKGFCKSHVQRNKPKQYRGIDI